MSDRAPTMLWLPPRNEKLPECWIAVSHIVSIHYMRRSVILEIDNKRTLLINYADEETAQIAARRFAQAMQSAPSQADLDAYPNPIDGDIVRMA